jgi:hypothetical protein
MADRSTLYRRRTGRSLPGVRKGGRHEKGADDALLPFVAALIEERRRSVGVDYAQVRIELSHRIKRKEVRSILRELRKWNHPPGCIAVACAKVLKLGSRTRRARLDDEEVIEKLREEYPYMGKSAISKHYFENPDAPWIKEALRSCPAITPGLVSQECPSRIFPITRPMISYWRRSDPEKFHACVDGLGWLAFPDGQPMPPKFMPSRASL